MMSWRLQQENLAVDDDNSVVFDVSSQQNVCRDDSHSVSSSLNEASVSLYHLHFVCFFKQLLYIHSR